MNKENELIYEKYVQSRKQVIKEDNHDIKPSPEAAPSADLGRATEPEPSDDAEAIIEMLRKMKATEGPEAVKAYFEAHPEIIEKVKKVLLSGEGEGTPSETTPAPEPHRTPVMRPEDELPGPEDDDEVPTEV